MQQRREAPFSVNRPQDYLAGLYRDDSGQRQRAVIIAMVAVRMMQVAVYQIIDVIAMRNRLMPATRTMHVVGGMSAAAMVRGANLRIGLGYGDDVLVHVIAVRMMQMAVVQIIHVTVMDDCRVSAVRAVLVGMVGVSGMSASAHDGISCKG